MSNQSMNQMNKNVYLVEATGGIAVKKIKYTATDPDNASYLAFRHEAFYRAQIKYPGITPDQVLALIENMQIEMPDFKVKKISLVPSEVKN